jgi:hypothetical protein
MIAGEGCPPKPDRDSPGRRRTDSVQERASAGRPPSLMNAGEGWCLAVAAQGRRRTTPSSINTNTTSVSFGSAGRSLTRKPREGWCPAEAAQRRRRAGSRPRTSYGCKPTEWSKRCEVWASRFALTGARLGVCARFVSTGTAENDSSAPTLSSSVGGWNRSSMRPEEWPTTATTVWSLWPSAIIRLTAVCRSVCRVTSSSGTMPARRTARFEDVRVRNASRMEPHRADDRALVKAASVERPVLCGSGTSARGRRGASTR